MNKAGVYSIAPAFSGGVAGIYIYMASVMSGDRAFETGSMDLLKLMFCIITASVVFTIIWMAVSVVFIRVFGNDPENELKINSAIFGIPSITILLLPVFLKLNSRLAGLDLKVLGWIYRPGGGFTHYTASGYFILMIIGLMTMLCAFPVMIRFIKELHDASERMVMKKKLAYMFISMSIFTAITTSYVTIVYPPTGDEPHYLTIAKSIGDDLDVNLENQYITQKTYKSFYPVELEYENLHNTTGRGGKGLYSTHNAGVSFLIAPFLKFGGRLGVQLLMNILTAFLSVFLFVFLKHIGIRDNAAVFTSMVFGITSPVLMCSSLALTEIPSAILILYCCAYIYAVFEKNSAFYDIELAGIKIRNASVIYFAALASMTWFHSKLALMSLIFYAAYYAVTFRKKSYKTGCEIVNNAAVAVLGGLFIYYYYAVFGVFAISGIRSIHENSSYYFVFDLWNAVRSFFAVLFDRNYGLFIYNPLFIISLWGAMLAWHRKNYRLLLLFLFTLPYYMLFLFWSDWTGSMIPARQMVPMAMVWAVFYAYFMDEMGFQRTKTFMVMLFTAFTASFCMMVLPPLRYAVSKEKIYTALGSIDRAFLWIFPSFAKNPPVMDIMALVYFAVIIWAFYFVTKGKLNSN
jgi:hypothetical protein